MAQTAPGINLLAILAAAMLSAPGTLAQTQGPPSEPPATPQPEPAPEPAPPQEPEEPPEVIVTLKDGQRISGLLEDRTDQRLLVRIGGITTEIKASFIDRVQVLPPMLERYREMRAAIDDADTESRMRLIDWLRDRARYDLALAEADALLAHDPANGDARRLRDLVAAQRDLAAKSKARRAQGGQPKPDGDAGAPKGASPRTDFPLLTPDQVNLIRVYEVELADPPPMQIDRDTIARLMTDHAGDPLIPASAEGRDAMFRKRPAQILDLMFRLQARDLYGQVRVLDNPRAMRRFRDDVHQGWLMNSCATSRCHGGEEAGRLWLFNKRPNAESTFYTNFLILDRFRRADGKPLIDYDEPQRSPLLQMAIRRDRSLYPHPAVPGKDGKSDLWKPVFQSTDDRRYIQAVDWIRGMYRPRPEYPIAYQPPMPLAAAPAPDAGPPKQR